MPAPRKEQRHLIDRMIATRVQPSMGKLFLGVLVAYLVLCVYGFLRM
jgi:hypothetical protein